MKDNKKFQQNTKAKKPHAPKEESIGKINKRIRDLKRTLQKVTYSVKYTQKKK